MAATRNSHPWNSQVCPSSLFDTTYNKFRGWAYYAAIWNFEENYVGNIPRSLYMCIIFKKNSTVNPDLPKNLIFKLEVLCFSITTYWLKIRWICNFPLSWIITKFRGFWDFVISQIVILFFWTKVPDYVTILLLGF